METFSTVLFVDQAPVGYRVQRSLDRIEFNPAGNPSRLIQPPQLVAQHRGGRWEVAGTENPELVQQVLEEVAAQNVYAPAQLSAAP